MNHGKLETQPMVGNFPDGLGLKSGDFVVNKFVFIDVDSNVLHGIVVRVWCCFSETRPLTATH